MRHTIKERGIPKDMKSQHEGEEARIAVPKLPQMIRESMNCSVQQGHKDCSCGYRSFNFSLKSI